MGFHLREYRRAVGDESEMYSARIFRGDAAAGFARNEGSGGPDILHIEPEHRAAWQVLTRYLEDHPIALREDGSREELVDGEQAALLILRDLHEAELSLSRSRKYRSGLVAFTWDRPLPGGGWWATTVVLLSPADEVTAADAAPHLFRVLVLGRDNDRFAREDAPLRPTASG